MAHGVDRLGPISPRSPMLIEHRPSHPNKGPILALNNTILLRDIRRGKLMLEAQRSTKGFKMSILEFCAIVTMNRSHGVGAESDQHVNIYSFAIRCDRRWPSTQ